MASSSERSGGEPMTPMSAFDGMRTPVSPGDSRAPSGNSSSMIVPNTGSTVRTRRRRELSDAALYSRPSTPGGESSMASPMTVGGDDEPPRLESHAIIFGTDVNMADCQDRLLKFLNDFQRPDDEKPFYKVLIAQLHETQTGILNVDLRHLHDFDSYAYDLMVRFPTELIAIFDNVFETYWSQTFEDEEDEESSPRLEVRILGLQEGQIRSMRQLDPANINQLVGIRGMVIRASQTIPDLTIGFYRCLECYNTVEVSVNRGHLPEPTRCANCSGRNTFHMIHNRNTFADKQVVRLQEAPENIPQGETPATLSVLAYDSLVDTARPGDRVEVTGILRAVTIRVNPRMRSVRNIFRTYVDLVHMRVMRGAVDNNESTTGQESFAPLSDDQKEEFASSLLSESDNIYQRLSDSLAPSIFGMEDAKKGVLLQLLGGTRKEFTKLGGTRFRGELNVLLVGDPGTSKSQILQCVNRLAPRGIYTSGRGSSAVGLTAYVTRDPETRDAVLESGALVLSDEGVCCIDEFDKMSEHTRSILHEAMEQQTVSIAKAGIVATLNARTSVLAAANPIESKYNSSRSVVDNIDLPPTLLSRFDLVFLVLDQPNATEDRRLAKHIVSLFYPGEEQPGAGRSAALEARSLAQYIAYAREKIQPQLTDEASQRLVSGYVEMRGGADGTGTRSIGATTRQLESLIRLSEAHARARLSNEVEIQDVEEAQRLMIASIQQSAIDPRTGLIDMDLLMTGRSNAARSQTQHLASAIWSALTEDFAGRHGTFQEVLAHVRESSSATVSDADFREAVTQLRDESRLHFAAGQRLVPHVDHAM